MSDNILRFENISKTFPGVKALKNMSFEIHRGDVHVLLGENGAGKSTLIKILTGVYQADEGGTIYLNDEPVKIHDTLQSRKLGIGTVFQENSLIPHLNVAENVFLTREIRGATGAIDWKKTYAECKRWIQELGVDHIDPRTPVRRLSVADQQIVEIVKVFSQDPSIVILDEPTSSLSDHEIKVHKGEVLGFSGLVGSGRTSTAKAIIGAIPRTYGTIKIDGKPVKINNPSDAIACGIGYLPEDRKYEGLLLTKTVKENISLPSLRRKFSRGIVINSRKERDSAEEYKEKLRIKTPSINRMTKFLSGGNQQKVVFAKWLCSEANIYIFDEPTRGIDVGAKSEIYQIINDLVAQGAAVIVISSELPEILGICDRVIVMRDGRITANIDRADATQEKIMSYSI